MIKSFLSASTVLKKFPHTFFPNPNGIHGRIYFPSNQASDLGEDRTLLIGAVKRPAPDNLPTDSPGINQLSYLALSGPRAISVLRAS